MYTLLKPLQVRDELLQKKIKVFTPEIFHRVFHTPAHKTKYFLEKQVQEGLFLRLKQGLYALRTDLPAEEEIANVLYKPSYLSFEYVLAYYSIIPERPYIITSSTTRTTATFSINNKEFAYYSIKDEAYTGYYLRQSEIKSFLIAEPEKALIDYLYFVTLGKRSLNDRFYTKDLSREKLFAYAKLYKRKSIEELINKIYDNV